MSNRDHEETYLRAAELRKKAGDSTPYDQVLHGLAAVLSVHHSMDISTTQLSDLFHCPLATTSERASLPEVAKSLDACLPQDAEDQKLVGEGLRSLMFPAGGEDDVRRLLCHLAAEEVSLASSVRALRGRIKQVRRKADIVELLLGGGTDRISSCRQGAVDLETQASYAEKWVVDTRRSLEKRLEDLPRERAESLRPISELKSGISTFGGNIAGEDSDYVTDGALILARSAARNKAAHRRILSMAGKPRTGRRKSGDISDDAILNWIQGDPTDVESDAVVVGYTNRETTTGKQLPTAVVLSGDSIVYADARYLRLVETLIPPFELRVRPERKALVFVVGGKTVGILGSLYLSVDDLPLDLTAVQKKAGMLR